MKIFIFGAAAMLLSSTAMAAIPGKAKANATASAPVAAKASEDLGEAMIGNAITLDWPAKRADARAIDTKHIVAAAKAPPEAPAAETPSTTALSDAGKGMEKMTGMGGPEEPVDGAVPASMPTASYRPCSPGPGDDNCIQLYEPGVREALASWEASRAGGQQLAMGGPDEADELEAAGQSEEVAAYEPLPEDAVMPASEELAYTDAPTRGPNLTPAI